MGTTHIGKFDLQKPCGQPSGSQSIEGNHLSNLATSYERGNFILLPPFDRRRVPQQAMEVVQAMARSANNSEDHDKPIST